MTCLPPVVIICVNLADEHKVLEHAMRRQMTMGDFVFITMDHLPPDNIETPWVMDGANRTDLIPAYRVVQQGNGHVTWSGKVTGGRTRSEKVKDG